jgi:hypothetical protein
MEWFEPGIGLIAAFLSSDNEGQYISTCPFEGGAELPSMGIAFLLWLSQRKIENYGGPQYHLLY